jgi:DeoR/GlpR family transcriptional regulator of sugar metabolism
MSADAGKGTGRALLPLQRREQLMEELRAHGAITVRGIASMLGVSELTIRRELDN